MMFIKLTINVRLLTQVFLMAPSPIILKYYTVNLQFRYKIVYYILVVEFMG